MRTTGKHAVVLGSGIAGLALAEILSRNGWRITLLESSPDLGGDASRRTQNWLHTGWLYAGLPNPSAMQGCALALRLFRRTYARVLPGEVVNVEADAHGVAYPASPSGWFSAEPMHYAFALSSYDLSTLQRATWPFYLDGFLLRRLRGLGYPTTALADVPPRMIDLMQYWEGTQYGHAKYRVVPSTDARINTKCVLATLLGLLGEETEVVTNASYDLFTKDDRAALQINGELHVPDLCVIATGKSVPSQLRALGAHALANRFKSFSSPIMVLKRALALPNFIRFTPNLPETLNHVKYSVDGEDVSTVGSYDFYPTDSPPDIHPFEEKMCRRLNLSLADVIGCYYGTKTELTGIETRRYNHAVDKVNANTVFAIAGKFSQFPLLVNEFATANGLSVDIDNPLRGKLALSVAATAPERLVYDARREPQTQVA
jgi:hypothetical protein